MKLRLGLPKGSLQESTFALFKKAGFNLSTGKRSYLPSVNDEELEIVLMRAQEIPVYVERGVLEAGITGKDWILENKIKIKEVCELIYAKQGYRKVMWVLAVPKNSKIKSVKDLKGKIISTEVINITKDYLKKNNVSAKIEFSWGATEVKPPLFADAIIELTETGSTLHQNNLKIIDVVLESTTYLIANKKVWQNKKKREKIENLAILLKGALDSEGKVGLKMNIPRKKLRKIISLLPSLKNPTVSNLTDENWVAIEVVVDEKKVREIIPALKRRGARDIIEYSLSKVIP
jgi:ATP phosphoribosyltransferase